MFSPQISIIAVLKASIEKKMAAPETHLENDKEQSDKKSVNLMHVGVWLIE